MCADEIKTTQQKAEGVVQEKNQQMDRMKDQLDKSTAAAGKEAEANRKLQAELASMEKEMYESSRRPMPRSSGAKTLCWDCRNRTSSWKMARSNRYGSPRRRARTIVTANRKESDIPPLPRADCIPST